MPSRNFQEHMIVTTDKGEMRVDKDGNMTPIPDELTDEQLEWVVGGQNYERFGRWRCRFLNEHTLPER